MLSGFKKAVAARFNLKKWMGYDHLKDNASFIKHTYQDLLRNNPMIHGDKAANNMSFEEMMQLYRLSDKDIKEAIKSCSRNSWAFLCIAIAPIAYAGYLFTLDIILGGIVSFLIGCLCLAHAYRFQVIRYKLKKHCMRVSPGQVLLEWFHLGRK